MLGKIFSAIISKSLSIASSAVESTIDLMLNFTIWWAARAIRKRNPYFYPQGLYHEKKPSITIEINFVFI